MPLRVLSPQQKRKTLEISSLSRIWRRKYCDVAQLVEHLTLTQKVVGSKPAITTMESKPGRVWEPSGKRVGHLFGCVSNTLLSATRIVNWVGAQDRFESGTH